ncbi:MAG: nucleotidyltransferase family protein, partial [Bacilli bacterium]|nr:nucleotidyltransferase family protein [Bacilli bacterium]
LKNYYVGAGSINQTVFNYYHDFDLDYGIKDFDIVYFDEDTSYEKEDKVIKNIRSLIKNINIEVDIKNEARVHLWYKDKFGFDIQPYTSVEEAISKWGTTVTCIGVRLENDELVVFAPYGLNDVFGLIIRPIKENFNKYHYDIKVERWLNTWPKLKVIKWNDQIK